MVILKKCISLLTLVHLVWYSPGPQWEFQVKTGPQEPMLVLQVIRMFRLTHKVGGGMGSITRLSHPNSIIVRLPSYSGEYCPVCTETPKTTKSLQAYVKCSSISHWLKLEQLNSLNLILWKRVKIYSHTQSHHHIIADISMFSPSSGSVEVRCSSHHSDSTSQVAVSITQSHHTWFLYNYYTVWHVILFSHLVFTYDWNEI